MGFDLSTIVAQPYYAPTQEQIAAPRESYGFRPPVMNSPDLQRILALPRRALELDGTERAEALIDLAVDQYGYRNDNCDCRNEKRFPGRHAAEGCIDRPRLVQALALREISICGGLLGPIGVGHGKTMLDLLAPIAFSRHAERSGLPFGDKLLCVLFVPPKLLPQLSGDYDYIGQHLVMPSMVVQGSSEFDRIRPGMPKLQVMPYSRLQRAEATSWMNVVKPHAVIGDECHKLRNIRKPGRSGTATANRVANYMEANPTTRGAFWSGSMTSKSLQDYDHLARWALRDGSPVPTDPEAAADWARAIDPSKNPADPGALLDGLIATGCCKPGQSLHSGFRTRLIETLGVVTASQPSVDCDLELVEREITTRIPDTIHEHIKNALDQIRPDGEELVTAMEATEVAIQIACGFHYKWIFPRNVFPEDTPLVDDWRLKRKEWHKELRGALKHPQEHLDSPLLLRYAAERYHGLRPKTKELPVWGSQCFMPWRDIEDKVYHESVPVRLDDFYVRDVCNWAATNTGIVWYWHKAFGEWVAEMSGLPLFGADKESSKELLKQRGERSIIVSAKAHGTGTNGLQFYFWNQYFTNPPGEPQGWEQTLGRLHRQGQPSKLVRAYFAMHTPQLRKHVRSALYSALYVQSTGFGDQKLHVGFPDGLLAELTSEDDEE